MIRNREGAHERPAVSIPVYALVTALLVVCFLGVGVLNNASAVYQGTSYDPSIRHYADHDQYARLADALLHGSVSLDLPVPDELAELENPYAFENRDAIQDGGNVPIFWDHAFYEGKYYCYFGVVPAVLLYAPYQLITGSWLATPAAVAFLGSCFLVCAALLLYRVARRYFARSATTGSLVLALLFMFAGSNVVYLGFVPTFYSVPILTSMVFTMLGLWFWMGARREGSSGGAHGGVTLSAWHLAAGSACMALNLGCRPQFMLACFLALPLFWREITRERLLFSRAGLGSTLAALVPFVVVFAPLFAYNYVRFGSLLDFGSFYNLTGFDMIGYNQSWRLTPVLLFYYLLQPFNLSGSFPFVQATDLTYPVGWAPFEPMYGGYFWLVPCALLVLALPVVRRELKQRNLWGVSLLMLLFAAVVLVADARTAGITQRYFSDFGWYLMLVAAFVLFALQARAGEKGEKGARRYRILVVVLAVSLGISALVGLLSLFSPAHYASIAALNPALYDAVAGLFG